jgi:pyruvate-formate lyase
MNRGASTRVAHASLRSVRGFPPNPAARLSGKPCKRYLVPLCACSKSNPMPAASRQGRFDQYMLPFLEQDLLSGKAKRYPKLQMLLEYLWLKFNEVVLLRSSSSARYFAGFPIRFQYRCWADSAADGSDATNFLSYMCLRAQADLGLTQPNLSIRIHSNSPQEFLLAASSVVGKGSGMPQVFNDEVIVPGQLNRGIAPRRRAELRCGRLCGTLHARKSAGVERCLNVQFDPHSWS